MLKRYGAEGFKRKGFIFALRICKLVKCLLAYTIIHQWDDDQSLATDTFLSALAPFGCFLACQTKHALGYFLSAHTKKQRVPRR